MSNKKLLKNLLATASMVAVLAGGATNAAAGSLVYTARANVSHTSNGAGEIKNDLNADAALIDGKILSTNGAHAVIFDQENTVALWITDAGLNHQVNSNTIFTAIAGANTSTFVVAANRTMTLFAGATFTDVENDGNGDIAANTFTGLGAVTVGNGGSVTVGDGINLVATSTINATLGNAGNGSITFSGTSTVNSVIGGNAGLALVTFNGDSKSNVTFAANAAATTFNIANAGTVTVNAGSVLAGRLTGPNGKLVLGAGAQVTGAVGAVGNGNALASVDVTGAAGNMGALYTKALNLHGNGSVLQFAGGNVDAITTDTNGQGAVTATAATTFGTVGAEGKALATLALQGAVAHTLNGDVYATNVTANDAATVLLLGTAVKINGAVDGTAAGRGVVRIQNAGKNTITGDVGTTQPIANIEFLDANGTLNIEGNIVRSAAITGYNVAGNGNILNLTNEGAVTLTGTVAANASNLSINFSSKGTDVTLNGLIAAAATPLKALSATAASKVIFGANNAYITKLDATNVELAGATYMFGSVTKDVTMKLTADATFAANTKLDGFKSLDLNNRTATFTAMNLTGGSIIGNGSLVFTGDSTYNTTATGTIANVTAGTAANAANFTLAKDLTSTAFTFGAVASTATINAALKANVTGNAANNSKLVLGKGSSVTGNVNMDANGVADAITVAEGVSTKIDGTLANAGVTLSGKGASLEVTKAAANTVSFITTGDNVDTLILGGDYTTPNAINIGGQNRMFKSITLTNDTRIVLDTAVAYVTNIYNSADKQGNVTFGAVVNAPIYNIGTASSRFNVVTLAADSTLKGDIYASTLARGANNLTIEDGKSVIVTDSTGAGNITFNGNGTFSGTFGLAVVGGRVGDLAFNGGDATVKGSGVVYANDIAHNGELMLTGKLTLDSANAATFVDGSTINASSYAATYTKATFAPGSTVNIKVALTDSSNGSVTASNGNAVTFADTAKLSLTVADKRKVSNARNSGAVKVIDFTTDTVVSANNLKTALDALTINEAAGSSRFLSSGNKLATTLNGQTVTGSLSAKVDTHVSDDMRKLGASESVQKFAQTLDASNGQFDTVLDSIDTLNDKDYVNAIERFTNSSSDVVSNAGLNVVTDSMNQVANRTVAVASGDAGVEVGAWVEGIIGQGEQKKRKGQAGFKSNASGVVIGVDTELNDASIIGIAATMANTDVKMKDYLEGDKSKVQSYMASVYGSYNFADNFMLQGSASFGNNTVKNTNKRILNDGAVNAKSKFDGTAFGVKAMVGYDYKISDMASVTPMTGLEYARFDAGNATETGAGAQNRKVQVKATDKLTGILGAKVKANIDLGSDMIVTPEMHVFGGYDFKGSTAKSVVKLALNDANIPVSNVKAARTSFNVGGSITTKYDNMEYGIGYDAKISDKYFGQQGSLKVRVNF